MREKLEGTFSTMLISSDKSESHSNKERIQCQGRRGLMHRAHCIITIIRGIERLKIVDDDKDREHFVTRLGKIRTETKTIIYAWALMTNQAHLLLHSGPEGIAPFMRRFPQNTQSHTIDAIAVMALVSEAIQVYCV
jgi:hypothetical protein